MLRYRVPEQEVIHWKWGKQKGFLNWKEGVDSGGETDEVHAGKAQLILKEKRQDHSLRKSDETGARGAGKGLERYCGFCPFTRTISQGWSVNDTEDNTHLNYHHLPQSRGPSSLR